MNFPLCVCGSLKQFGQCCQPFLIGRKQPKTPVQLMRSRFSAFAIGGFGDHLLRTWLPEAAKDHSEFELSQRSVNWQRLTIIDKSQKGDRGVVEFKAIFVDDDGDQQTHHEISQFHRVGGRWYYASGRVIIE
jgi:SEC-C motif-containing protein